MIAAPPVITGPTESRLYLAMASTEDRMTGAATATQDKAITPDAPAQDAQSDNAASADHVHDEKAAATPTKWQELKAALSWQNVKAHLIKRKWWYLLGLVIFLAILLPLL